MKDGGIDYGKSGELKPTGTSAPVGKGGSTFSPNGFKDARNSSSDGNSGQAKA